jgi:hypothetical protein
MALVDDLHASLPKMLGDCRPFQTLTLFGTVDICHDRFRFSSDHVSGRSDAPFSTYPSCSITCMHLLSHRTSTALNSLFDDSNTLPCWPKLETCLLQ